MGLHSGGGPPGLASILQDSPRDRATLSSLDLIKISSNLQSAVEYVLGGGAGAAAAAPLVSDEAINFDAVEQRIQQGMLTAAQAVAGHPEAAPEPAEAAGPLAATGSAGAEPTTVGQDREESAGSDAAVVDPQEGQQPQDPGQPAEGPSGDAAPPPVLRAAAPGYGRLGPAHVSLVKARGDCDIDGLWLLSRSNFSTVRSNACVYKGRWMYELQLGSSGLMQVGWTTLQARFSSEDGVGDTHDSYGYDGRRRLCWHISNITYGERWAAGDIIGCCLDLDAGTIRFLRNGKDMGVAFSNVRQGTPGMAYFAGVSLSFAESCEVNFGGRPFRHPLEGYQPLQQAPAAPLPLLDAPPPEAAGPADERRAQVAAARYLAACLCRLVDVSSAHAAPLEAAMPASKAARGNPAEENGDGQGGEQGADRAALGHEEEPSALPPLPHWAVGGGHGQLPGSPLHMLAPAGPGKGTAASEEDEEHVPADGSGGGGAAPGASALFAEDRLLLGSLLAQFLGPLCFDPYICEGVLLEAFDDMAGELAPQPGSGSGSASADSGASTVGEEGTQQASPQASPQAGLQEGLHASQQGGGQQTAAEGAGCSGSAEALELGRARLAQLLRLLAAVLEPEELAALAEGCCEALACRVRGCEWRLAELPASAALSALRLWSAMLDCDELREAWLASSVWEEQLEQLLVVRQPSEDDLEQLLANLKVEFANGGAVVRNRRRDQNQFTADVARLTSGLEAVEAAQADILLRIWLQPGGERLAFARGGSSGSGRRGLRLGGREAAAVEDAAAGGAQRPHGGAASAAPAGPSALAGTPAWDPTLSGHHLRRFLAHLVDKNKGALRHVPPPGLSDQTSLASAAFALLRLMNEHVAAALPEVPAVRWDPRFTFLLGVRPCAGSDPYHDAGRMAGTVSHVAREHPPTEGDFALLEPVALGAVVKYDAPLRLAEHALEGPSFSDVWLRDRLLMLCHLAVAPLMHGSLRHMGAMQAAMAGLRATSGPQPGASTGRLQHTRRQCRAEFVRALRAHEWDQVWLLPPWRQQAAFVLAVATAQVVGAVSAQEGNLLRYVPEFYVTAPLDMVHAIHRCEPAAMRHAAMMELGLGHLLELVVAHLNDKRIVSPEVQARLASMVLDGVQELDLVRELGTNPVSRRRLLPAMMRLLGHEQLWSQASSFFALLVEGCGFMHPPAAFPPEFAQPVGALRGLMLEACQQDPELCSTFLHRLFDNLNRMLTELVAALQSTEGRLGPGQRGVPPSTLRLLASTTDQSVVLLRTLEVLAAQLPHLFLGSGGSMNLTRLAEVLGFAVPQLVGGKLQRVLQRLAASPTAQMHLRSAHPLLPLVGILLELWQAQRSGPPPPLCGRSSSAGGSDAGSEGGGSGGESLGERAGPPAVGEWGAALLRALNSQSALTDDVLQGLLREEMALSELLAAEVAAAADDPSRESEEQLAARHAADAQRLADVVDALVGALRAARDGGGGGGGRDDVEGDSGEVPDEFLDPILATVMSDPVLLPDSRVTVDRATIERHLLSSASDPFSRAPLARHQLQPDEPLRQRIQDWRAQRAEQRRRGEGAERG